MKRSIKLFAASAVLGAAAVAAGCGGSSGTAASPGSSGNNSGGYSYGGSSKGAGRTSKPAAGSARIAVADSSLGRILVDGRGRTLYLFEKDTGTSSTCFGACASVWPPATTSGALKVGEGAISAKLGTTTRSDGTLQVTYGGHPLYTYVGDTKPGDTNGEGLDQFGAEWYVVSAAGGKVENS